MATNAKIVLFMGGGEWGWTEEWYWSATADNLPLATPLGDAKSYISLRRAFLSSLWSVQGALVELVDATGASFTVGRSLTAYQLAGAGPGAVVSPCANPWNCLLQNWYTADNSYRRSLLLRGIPDAWLCIDSTYSIPFTPNADLVTAMTPWSVYVQRGVDPNALPPKSGLFCLRVIDKARGRGLAVMVTAADVDSQGYWSVTTDSPVLVGDGGTGTREAGQGDVIHVHSGFNPTLNGLNGNHVVRAVFGGPSYLLDARQCVPCTPTFDKSPSAWGVSYILVPVTSQELSRITNRPTGGPFFGTRGRRRACRT